MITDEGSVHEMRIWSILLIESDLNGVYILVEVSFCIAKQVQDYPVYMIPCNNFVYFQLKVFIYILNCSRINKIYVLNM